MRILVLTNLFPPAVIGGYEIGCKDLVDELGSRGHDMKVLTSVLGADLLPPEPDVVRRLPLLLDDHQALAPLPPIRRAGFERQSQTVLRAALARWEPDLVLAFNMRFIARSALFLAQESAPVGYLVSDPWLQSWRHDDDWLRWMSTPGGGRRRRVAARLAAFVPQQLLRTTFGTLDLERVIFVSEHLKAAAVDAGVAADDASVVHWGIDTQRFGEVGGPIAPAERFLFVGQLLPHKGVEVAIRALGIFTAREGRGRLAIAGRSGDEHYTRSLHLLVDELGLAERVEFLGHVERDALPAVYRSHDALLAPAMWDEPFSIVLLEAMSSGTVVVASRTGGTPELVADGVNGLLFDRGDADGCALAMAALGDPARALDLRRAGRATIEQRHTLASMADRVDLILAAWAQSSKNTARTRAAKAASP